MMETWKDISLKFNSFFVMDKNTDIEILPSPFLKSSRVKIWLQWQMTFNNLYILFTITPGSYMLSPNHLSFPPN